jgi:hypothetical protein
LPSASGALCLPRPQPESGTNETIHPRQTTPCGMCNISPAISLRGGPFFSMGKATAQSPQHQPPGRGFSRARPERRQRPSRDQGDHYVRCIHATGPDPGAAGRQPSNRPAVRPWPLS